MNYQGISVFVPSVGIKYTFHHHISKDFTVDIIKMELKAKILSQVILQSQLLSTPHLTLHYTLVSGIVFCFSIISHILGKYT